MPRAGLSFVGSDINPMGLGLPSRPNQTFDPTKMDQGLAGLTGGNVGLRIPNSGSQVSLDAFRQQLDAAAQPASYADLYPKAPEATQSPTWFNPNTRELSVNGFVFREDDANAALQSKQYLDRPPVTPAGQGWVPMQQSAYDNYIGAIENPGAGTLFAKGIERGMRGSQLLAGSAVQLLGAEQLGQSIVDDAAGGMLRNSPYERQVRDVSNPSEAFDWAVSAFGESLPSIFESAAAALVGFTAGTATATPLGGAAGSIMAVAAKGEAKKLLLEAVRKRMAGEALEAAEAAALKRAAGTIGAVAGAVSQNYATGVADIYSELRDQGAVPEDMLARFAALGGAVPYAALETAPEFLLGLRMFGVIGRGGIASRMAKAAAVGALAEGSTEAGQEGLNVSIAGSLLDKEVLTDENLARVIEAGAAGAVPGFIFGGASGVARSADGEQDLMAPPPITPAAPTQPTGPIGPTRAPGAERLRDRNRPGNPFTVKPLRDPAGPTPNAYEEYINTFTPTQAEPNPRSPEEFSLNGAAPLPPGVVPGSAGAGISAEPSQYSGPRVGVDPAVADGRLRDIFRSNPATANVVDPHSDADITAYENAAMDEASGFRNGVRTDPGPADFSVGDTAQIRPVDVFTDHAANSAYTGSQVSAFPVGPQGTVEVNLDTIGVSQGFHNLISTDPSELPTRWDHAEDAELFAIKLREEFSRKNQDVGFRVTKHPVGSGYGVQVVPAPSYKPPASGLPSMYQGFNPLASKAADVTPTTSETVVTPSAPVESETNRLARAQLEENENKFYTSQDPARRERLMKVINAARTDLGMEPFNPNARTETNIPVRTLTRQTVKDALGTTEETPREATERPAKGSFRAMRVTKTERKEMARGKTPQSRTMRVATLRNRKAKTSNRLVRKKPAAPAYEAPPTYDTQQRLIDPKTGEAFMGTAAEVRAYLGKRNLISSHDVIYSEDGHYAKRVEGTKPVKPLKRGLPALKTNIGRINRLQRMTTKPAKPDTNPLKKSVAVTDLNTDSVETTKAKTPTYNQAAPSTEVEKVKPRLADKVDQKNVDEMLKAAKSVRSFAGWMTNATTRAGYKYTVAEVVAAKALYMNAEKVADAPIDLTQHLDPRFASIVTEEAAETTADKNEAELIKNAAAPKPTPKVEPKAVTPVGDTELEIVIKAAGKLVELLSKTNPAAARAAAHKAVAAALKAFVASPTLKNRNAVVTAYAGNERAFDELQTKVILAVQKAPVETGSQTRAMAAPKKDSVQQLAQQRRILSEEEATLEELRAELKKHTAVVNKARKDMQAQRALLANKRSIHKTPSIKSLTQHDKAVAMVEKKLDEYTDTYKAAVKQETSLDEAILKLQDKIHKRTQKILELSRLTGDTRASVAYTALNTGNAVKPIVLAQINKAVKKITKNWKALHIANVELKVAGTQADFDAALIADGAYTKQEVQSMRNDDVVELAMSYFNKRTKRYAILLNAELMYSYDQIEFSLAHEAMGHFGIQSVVPEKQLHMVLEDIYKTDRRVRQLADAKEVVYGSRAEGSAPFISVEEALADMAAKLNYNTFRKIWNTLNDALRSIFGRSFDDSAATILLSRARHFIRTGEAPRGTTFQDIMNAVSKAATRASAAVLPADAVPLGDAAGAATGIADMTIPQNGLPGLVSDARRLGDKFTRKVAEFLEYVQTTDNVATRSYGFSLLLDVFRNIGDASRNMLSKYQLMTETARTPSVMKTKRGEQGATEAERAIASELLAFASLNRLPTSTDKVLAALPPLLVQMPSGEISVDPVARLVAESKGLVKAEEFENLAWQFANGIDAPAYKRKVGADSTEYRIYRENFEAISESAIDKLESLIDSYGVLTKERFDKALAKYKVTAAQRKWFDQVRVAYTRLAMEKSKASGNTIKESREARAAADAWLASVLRTLHTPAKIKDWKKGAPLDAATDAEKKANAFVNSFRARSDFDAIMKDIIAGMEDVNSIGITTKQQIDLNAAFNATVLKFKSVKEAELTAKRTIAGGYVPLKRRGKYQVRMMAKDENGKNVKLMREVQDMLPYFQTDMLEGATNGAFGAKEIAKELDTLLGGKTWDLKDEKGVELKVTLKAVFDEAKGTAGLIERVDFNDVVRVLDTVGIKLNPVERERIVTALENVNSRVRASLQRSATPGWDKDVLRSVDEYLETAARVSARTRYRDLLDGIMTTSENWFGSETLLKKYQAQFDLATNDAQRETAEQELIKFAYMYRHMGPKANGDEGKFTVRTRRGTQTIEFLGEGERYRDHGNKLLDLYRKQPDIVTSLDDLVTSNAAPLKMATVVMQLGGSPASAILNLSSIVTNVMPYLSGFNRDTGRGGGFGMVQTTFEVNRAAGVAGKAISLLDERSNIQDMLTNKAWAKFGLTEDEAIFMLKFTADGHFTPAQTNALIGSQKGKLRHVGAQKAIQAYMWMFNKAETYARVTAGLAAYRLYKNRAVAGGANPAAYLDTESGEVEFAYKHALQTLNYTLGEYAMYNRPAAFREGIGQYLFVYKQYVVTTLQLLRHLPAKEQAMMLGVFLLMSGLKGFPFAEDIMDLIDTIRQKLGMANANIELEMRKAADTFIPGSSKFLMHGVLDGLLGATVSTRTGMGDIIPLTGVFKAGADVPRELKDAAGPVYGAMSGVSDFAFNLADYVLLQKIGPQEGRETLIDVLRTIPVTGVRSLVEGAVFLSDGSVTNTRGQLITDELEANVLIARLLGFYPTSATEMNDIVRLSRETDNYAKSIKKRYVVAYARAARAGDQERMNEVAQAVADWNAANEGTEFEIRDFKKSAKRASDEASRTTYNRYRRTTSENIRPTVDELAAAYGIEPE